MKAIFYGRLGEVLGRELDLPAPARSLTVSEVRALIARLRPEAADLVTSPTLRACLDDAFVADTHPVPADGRIEFLPPLSGG